uniref:Uncharacterized protein n=1 Tax=Human herpesvirus 2 TaxID=10310 RepID=A0A481TT32_HHV2|nr:hypothetical protein [Human alphaherpesvirus 2]
MPPSSMPRPARRPLLGKASRGTRLGSGACCTPKGRPGTIPPAGAPCRSWARSSAPRDAAPTNLRPPSPT